MTIKLPAECLIRIFEHLKVTYRQEKKIDHVTLRSCSLVNRQWCAIAMPMLWEEPLMNLQMQKSTHDRFHMPITTYIMCLSDEAKTTLSKCGIIITPTLKRATTFNYASYLKYLDNEILFDATKMWIENYNNNNNNNNNTISKGEQNFIPIYQIYQLLYQLFKTFMERCDNLRQLRLKKSNKVSCPSDGLLQLHLLPGAEISLKNLNSFTFDGCMQSEIFFKMSEICKNIQHFKMDCVCNDNEGLAKLIQVQQRPLLSLSIEAERSNLPNLENALKNKVNSLTSLSISGMFSLDIFSRCKNLEKLTLTNMEPFTKNFMEKFVNSNFHKLRELQILLDYPFLYQISTLIKNTNENLTSIYLYWITPQDTNNYSLLITTIIMNCPNLREYLGSYPNEIVRYYLPLFFEKCSKLEYFYIYDNNSNFYDISSVMKLISNVIPKNLKMMWLSESWICNVEALSLFLECCEKRLSESLLFFLCNRTNQHDEIIRGYVAKNVLTNN